MFLSRRIERTLRKTEGLLNPLTVGYVTVAIFRSGNSFDRSLLRTRTTLHFATRTLSSALSAFGLRCGAARD
jgi:hypothetical protein